MQNFIQKGDVIDYIIPEDGEIESGQIVNVGPALSGVAGKSGVEGDVIPVHIRGVFELPKKSSLTISVGDEVYVDDEDGAVSKTVTDKPLGVAAEASLSSATTVKVILVPKKGDANGSISPATSVAAISTADGSDAGTTQTLANSTKAKVNEILTVLKNAGLMATE